MCQSKAQGGQRCYKDTCKTYMNSIKSGNVDKVKDAGRGIILTPNSIENFKAQGNTLIEKNKTVIVEGRQTVSSLENLNNNLDSLEEQNKTKSNIEEVSENYQRDLYIAIDKEASEEDLVMASKNKNADIRSIVALNPNTPPHILDMLSKDEDENVQASVASNPNTEDLALERLSESDSEYIRGLVAAHQNTDYFALDVLMEDKSEYVRSQVAANPSAEAGYRFYEIAKDESDIVREALVNNREISIDTISELANDKNPVISTKALQILEKADQAYSSDNANLLNRLSTSEYRVVALEVALNKAAPAEALENVAKHPNDFVRSQVAAHQNTSPKTLDMLSEDPHNEVVNEVASNPNTTPYTLVSISNKKRLPTGTVKILTENPNTPKSVVEYLANHNDIYVRHTVASTTNDPEIIAHLMNDENEAIRTEAFYNPNMPAPELHDAPTEWVKALLGEKSVNINTLNEARYRSGKGEK